MKISIVTETFLPSTDGVVTRLRASIDYLLDQGHDIQVIAPDLGVRSYRNIRFDGVQPRTFIFYKHRKFGMPTRSIKTYLEDFDPDLVHVVNPAFMGYSGIKYGRRLGVPLIASYHTHVPKYANYYNVSWSEPLLWWHFRRMHNKADINLCTSQAILEELEEQNFYNVHLWKRGVDTERFNPEHRNEKMRQRLTNGNPDKTLLLFVGRLAFEKEIDSLIPMLEQKPDAHLAIVGDGPYREELEKNFAHLNNVTFTGFLHGEELDQAYASSDAFMFPSTTETLGLVILEAMASGLPVIAAKSGPTNEQVEDGSTGLLYRSGPNGNLTEVVNRLDEFGLLKKMSKEAFAHSRDYGWRGPAQQLLNFYESAIELKQNDEQQAIQ
ncbi:glycosyltransferase family 4 protein [Guptibacillus hwajinpoensis]|uniref:Glycosyltransferase involved in cell wall biosynthesis n=1 Tax=Guptibacillus hwajinpoensis TaxID=208199 RepID=A0ABU0K848_9BACL|nr:glycosyltransferase family 1 protein [Alkalihalobacillus hemicentroti]MDQ0484508.1 glycosyltransferase involved in cell wall biosynthesis [Alkalihalobacillus hemicentroti]